MASGAGSWIAGREPRAGCHGGGLVVGLCASFSRLGCGSLAVVLAERRSRSLVAAFCWRSGVLVLAGHL